jgi:hypothetical protein
MLDDSASSAATVVETTVPGFDTVAPPVPARLAQLRIRDRDRESPRYRPGSRQARRLVGSRKDRLAFLELLARHGDPAVAADQMGLPLFVLFRHRDTDPTFAAEWLAAVNYAWERVESRVLAALLSDAAEAEAGDGKRPAKAVGSGVGQIDTRLALAIVNRRDKPVTHTGSARGSARVADGTAAARLRAELRARSSGLK